MRAKTAIVVHLTNHVDIMGGLCNLRRHGDLFHCPVIFKIYQGQRFTNVEQHRIGSCGICISRSPPVPNEVRVLHPYFYMRVFFFNILHLYM